MQYNLPPDGVTERCKSKHVGPSTTSLNQLFGCTILNSLMDKFLSLEGFAFQDTKCNNYDRTVYHLWRHMHRSFKIENFNICFLGFFFCLIVLFNQVSKQMKGLVENSTPSWFSIKSFERIAAARRAGSWNWQKIYNDNQAKGRVSLKNWLVIFVWDDDEW